MPRKHDPLDVIPAPVAKALASMPAWFVIGGHAVRCFSPYRPSDDVDFGVGTVKDLRGLVAALAAKGEVEILERAEGTTHLRFQGLDVSVFVLPSLRAFTEARTLTSEGILATKLHAILDRGTRRDFFDLYVMLQHERLGLIECFRALRSVYRTEVSEGLLLRALTFFDDAEREGRLPGEGPEDWRRVRSFFIAAAGALLVPPMTPLAIQRRVVDVRKHTARGAEAPASRKAGSHGSRTRASRRPPRRR